MTARRGPHAQTNAAPAQQAVASARFAFGGNAAEIPAEFIGHLVFLPAHVNQSQPSLFELDSTAAVTSVDPSRAAELGIGIPQAPVLNLSGVDISLDSLPQFAKKDFSAHVGRPYQGRLGNDVFAGVVIEVDYSRQAVRLYDAAAYRYAGTGTVLPLTFSGGMPVVQAKFSGQSGKMVEAGFIVNTALDASLVISDRFAQAHRISSSHMKTIPATDRELEGGEGGVFGRLSEFRIGPYRIERPIADFAPGNLPAGNDPRIAGEIGGGMLRRFHVVFDYARQQLILAPTGDFRFDDEEDMSGISIIAGGPGLKDFEVTDVQPGTPAADAKIQKGDVIAAVDDEAAADLSLAAIRKLFRQVNHKYKLLIERNGKSFPLTIQTRRLL
jgi:hypothetical protein